MFNQRNSSLKTLHAINLNQSLLLIIKRLYLFLAGARGEQGAPGPAGSPGPQGESSSTGSVVYTRWGRKHCPATSKTLEMYSGKNVLLRRKTLPNINITLRLGAMSFEILGLRDFCLVYP